MAEITLAAETGRATGSRSSNRLRAQGKIPGVVYGHGSDPTSVSVVWRDLRAALSGEAGMNALLSLEVDGETHLAIVKDVQRNPIHHTVSHVDFLLISRDEELTIDVPVVLVGEAVELGREDGIVEHLLFTLAVNAKPNAIPNEIPIDITALRLGDSVRVGDIALPSGVTTDVDADEVVVSTSITRAGIEAEGEAEGEAAEGEAGETAEASDEASSES
jgi:large subunit ribosomal protein L25